MGERSGGSAILCPGCGKLVARRETQCPYCGRRNPGMWGFGPGLVRLAGKLSIEQVVIWGCGALYLLSLVIDAGGIRMGGGLGFLSPSGRALEALGSSGAVPVVVQGRWWTLLSAGWLHGGLLHILFNMLWVRQLAPAAAAIYGTGRALLLYLLSSAVGFAFSSLGGAFVPLVSPIMGRAFFTVGASAAIFGLLGALVYAGRRGIGVGLGRQAWFYAIILFVFGLAMRGVDNWAHLGGFVGGFALARLFNPMVPERADHLLAALAVLGLSAIAILASLLPALAAGP